MSGLGALWGFVKSKLGSAAFLDVGTGAGDVVQLNGSAQLPAVDGSLLTGVGSGWTHDVTSSAELATALAVPGARIRATASFTVNSSLAISAGYYVLGRDDPDVQITFGSSGQLTAAAACGIDFYDPFWAKGDTPFVIAGGSFGACFQATTNLMLGGHLSIQGNTSGASLGCAFSFSGLRVRGGVSFQLSASAGWADSFIFEGTSSANAYLYSQCAGWGRALFRGLFRPFNSGGNIASNYTTLLYNPGHPTAPHYGPITFTEHSQNPAVCVQGNNGSRVILASVMSTDATYIPRVGLLGGADCRGGTFYPRYTDTSDAALVAFRGCRLLAPTFESGSDSHIHDACEFAEAFTFPSDSKPVLAGCFNTAALVFQSGSKPRIADHTIGNGTSITLDSGAAGRLVRTRGAGTGALTNNDPSSVVTLSENPASDTTPSTRRYGDPTLDALLDNHVAYWSGKASPCPNKAPLTACNAGGNLFTVTGNVLSVSDAFDLVDPTDQMMAILNGWAPGYGPFTLRLDIDLDVASGGEENIIGDGTGNFSLNLLSSGALRIYVGATYYDTSSSAITTGAGNQRVTLERTDTTLKIYVNGVQVLTTTDSSLIAPINYFYLGGVGANSIDGKVKKITLLNTGIADATEQLWDTYSLVGAGA